MSYIKHYGFDDEGNEQPLPKVPTPSPIAAEDAYTYRPALWGSAFGPTLDGQRKPQGKPEDIPTTIITRETHDDE